MENFENFGLEKNDLEDDLENETEDKTDGFGEVDPDQEDNDEIDNDEFDDVDDY